MKHDPWNYLPSLLGTLLSFFAGIYMYLNKKIGYGIDGITGQLTSGGHQLLFLISLILAVVTYYSFSPFSKIRNLFKKRKKK